MTTDILRRANRWRRGEEMPMPDPKEFGAAIDKIVEDHDKMLDVLKKYHWIISMAADQTMLKEIERIMLDNKIYPHEP